MTEKRFVLYWDDGFEGGPCIEFREGEDWVEDESFDFSEFDKEQILGLYIETSHIVRPVITYKFAVWRVE